MNIILEKMASLKGVKNLKRFKAALEFALPVTGLDADAPGLLRFVMVTKPRITALNALHLHHEGATDVITYDLRGGFRLPDEDEENETTLGEIYFCPAVAAEQAPKFGSTPSKELFLYAVHGMLHLAGEDDLTDQARAAMRLAETRVLAAVEEHFDLQSFC